MKKIIILSILLIFAINIFAQFGGSQNSDNQTKKSQKVSSFGNLNSKIARLQFMYRNKMSTIARNVKKSGNYSQIFTLLFFSFLYGVIHSLGPGHGKVITGSYFISEKVNIKKGVLAGFSFGFLHAISGLILVAFLYFIKTRKLQRSASISGEIQKISLIIIILLGLFLLIKHIYELLPSHKHISEKKSLFAMVLALGLIPCPGSVIVALFSINIDMFGLGIFMVLSMALGMSITISLIGVSMIFFRKLTESLSHNFDKTSRYLSPIFGIFGSLLMISFGIFFLL